MKAEPALFASVAASGVALSVGAWFASGPRAASSVAAGAAIAIANLWALRGIVNVLVASAAGARPNTGGSTALGFFLVPKLVALFGIVLLLVARNVVSAGPLALGYASLPIGVAIGALVCEKPAP